MRGRVMSILRVTDAFEPLGFVVGGALAAILGNQSGLLVAAAAGATMVALTAAVAGLTGERGSSGTR
jgi:hypothetical protein